MAPPGIRGLVDLAKDSVYVTVGFAVLVADRLRGRRHELAHRIGLEVATPRRRLREPEPDDGQ